MNMYSVSKVSKQTDGGVFLHKLRIFTCPLKLVGLGRAGAYSYQESIFKQKIVLPHTALRKFNYGC